MKIHFTYKPFVIKKKKIKKSATSAEMHPEKINQSLVSKVSYDIMKMNKDLHMKPHRTRKVSFI